MAVAELELDGVAADAGPAAHGDAGEFFLIGAAVLLAQQIPLAGVLGTGGPGAEALHGEVVFHAVRPAEGDLVSNDGDVLGGDHA